VVCVDKRVIGRVMSLPNNDDVDCVGACDGDLQLSFSDVGPGAGGGHFEPNACVVWVSGITRTQLKQRNKLHARIAELCGSCVELVVPRPLATGGKAGDTLWGFLVTESPEHVAVACRLAENGDFKLDPLLVDDAPLDELSSNNAVSNATSSTSRSGGCQAGTSNSNSSKGQGQRQGQCEFGVAVPEHLWNKTLPPSHSEASDGVELDSSVVSNVTSPTSKSSDAGNSSSNASKGQGQRQRQGGYELGVAVPEHLWNTTLPPSHSEASVGTCGSAWDWEDINGDIVSVEEVAFEASQLVAELSVDALEQRLICRRRRPLGQAEREIIYRWVVERMLSGSDESLTNDSQAGAWPAEGHVTEEHGQDSGGVLVAMASDDRLPKVGQAGAWAAGRGEGIVTAGHCPGGSHGDGVQVSRASNDRLPKVGQAGAWPAEGRQGTSSVTAKHGQGDSGSGDVQVATASDDGLPKDGQAGTWPAGAEHCLDGSGSDGVQVATASDDRLPSDDQAAAWAAEHGKGDSDRDGVPVATASQVAGLLSQGVGVDPPVPNQKKNHQNVLIFTAFSENYSVGYLCAEVNRRYVCISVH
jgi:hypothetical protein